MPCSHFLVLAQKAEAIHESRPLNLLAGLLADWQPEAQDRPSACQPLRLPSSEVPSEVKIVISSFSHGFCRMATKSVGASLNLRSRMSCWWAACSTARSCSPVFKSAFSLAVARR